jgi:hypothetical protein
MMSQATASLHTIRLTPPDTQRLLDLLDGMYARLGGPGTDADSASLQTLREKVADARALAQWLRDCVRVDLSYREAADLVQALATIHDEEDIAAADQTMFSSIFEQLEDICAQPPQLTPLVPVEGRPVAIPVVIYPFGQPLELMGTSFQI